MASGSQTEVANIDPANLPYGYAVTYSGRISGVTEPGELSVHYPFPVKDLVFLDDALKYGSRAAGARFAVYIGDLGADTAATAREVLATVPTPNNAVLLAVVLLLLGFGIVSAVNDLVGADGYVTATKDPTSTSGPASATGLRDPRGKGAMVAAGPTGEGCAIG